MRILILSFFISLSLFGLGRAQTVPSSEEPISVEFIIYSWQCVMPELRYSPSGKTEALPDPSSTTTVHSYTGPAKLNFYSASANLKPTADGAAPTPIASVTFPRDATQVMILSARAAGGKYQMYAIPMDDSTTEAPYIRLHNLTRLQLAVNYNEDDIVQVAPSSAIVIKPKGQATVIRVASFLDGKWRRAFNNVAELNEDGRKNIIFAPDKSRPVTMYTIPSWPEKETAPNVNALNTSVNLN